MILSPMRFKDYIWPHNPRVYEIDFTRKLKSHKVPFGFYILQSMGRSNRVLRGEGEFCGAGAYAEFQKLSCVFFDDTPGLLTHPLWMTTTAYFAKLSLMQEPTEDYVRYSFEFWECYDGYASGAKKISSAAVQSPAISSQSGQKWYTVVRGDCMWKIAGANGLTLAQLIALNPQIKNPNLIHPGDRIRTA